MHGAWARSRWYDSIKGSQQDHGHVIVFMSCVYLGRLWTWHYDAFLGTRAQLRLVKNAPSLRRMSSCVRPQTIRSLLPDRSGTPQGWA